MLKKAIKELLMQKKNNKRVVNVEESNRKDVNT